MHRSPVAPGSAPASRPPAGRRAVSDDALTAVVIGLLWAAVVMPSLVQSFTATKYRQSTGDEVALSALAALTGAGLTLGLIGLLLAVAVLRLPRLPTDRRLLLLVALAPWGWQVGRDLFVETAPKTGALVYPLLVFFVWAVRPRLRRLEVLGYLIALTALISLLMGALTPARGILSRVGGDAVMPDKQILPIGILIGPFTDGNPLGQFLALGVTAAFFIRNPRHRAAAFALVGAAVFWTSNRSSLIALAVGLAAVLALRFAAPALRRLGTVATGLAGLALVLFLPLATEQDGSFTNRGYIWRSSLERWHEDPWVGLGSQWYSKAAQYADNIGATAFHGHNQFVQSLVLGGAVGAALLGLLVLAAILRAGEWAARGVAPPAAFLAMLLVSSCFEVTLSLVHRSFLLPVTALPVLMLLLGRDDTPAPGESTLNPGTDARAIPLQARAGHPATPAVDLRDEDLWAPGGWRAQVRARQAAGAAQRAGGAP